MSKLIIIPTPIGNLSDVSERVLIALKTVNFLLAEDTRHTGNLLKLLGIEQQMKSYHKFNEHKMLDRFIEMIETSEAVGLVTDAGMPGISDPGYLIIKACIDNNIDVECIPGPTAIIPALVVSGFSTDRFSFEGFLPVKKGRKSRLDELKNENRTMVFYESPYRVGKTLKDMMEYFGKERRVSISREISKKFEETQRGTLNEVSALYSDKKAKGEFVIVVEGLKS